MVLSSEIQADLEADNDNKKPEMKLVLHSVFFGSKAEMDKMRDIVERFKKDVRDKWRIKIQQEDTEESRKKKENDSGSDPKKNEEESIFEKTRFGWLLRNLEINTEEADKKD